MERIVDRPRYLERIRPFMDVPVVKILTGVRRCGKSTLLDMVADEAAVKDPQARQVRLNLESREGLDIRTASALMEHLGALLPDRNARAHVFLDEIQQVPGWEDVVNALRVDWNCDLYLTGSNSTMLASELSTHLAGRFVEFPIRPLAFREFVELRHPDGATRSETQELFERYLVLGGFPVLKYFDADTQAAVQYLDSLLDTVVVKDVIEHFSIRDVDMFRRILRYCVAHVGRTFSAQSVSRYIRSEGRSVSVDTVLAYLRHCAEAYLVDKVPRLDVVGKQLLRADEKYYVVDQGLRTALGFDNRADVELALENIVHGELRSRGYTVEVGWRGAKEVDFVARRGERTWYVQVSYLLADQATADREFGVLEAIPDNHPKTVVSMDPITRGRNGIEHVNIVDFLMADPLNDQGRMNTWSKGPATRFQGRAQG
ncbi:MAG: ATP-binding protein [Arachnia propionica]|uniref:ATP-binding protein n=1 Tax=Arachnia propionica TaxID=1750 RepID=UPI002704993F|nr:ATP-binding protein [Arachnia propionica]